MKKQLLILKTTKELSQDTSYEELKKEISGSWKIRPHRLDNIEQVILLKNGKCIATFGIGNILIYNRESGRVDLELLNDNYFNNPDYIGKEFKYATSNPATICSKADFN